MDTWDIEVTDTFSGEANYSWSRRYTLEAPDGTSDLAIMRRAKALAGLTGVRGTMRRSFDGMEFRPFGANIIMFVLYHSA